MKKWAMLYPDLPSIEWFEQQNCKPLIITTNLHISMLTNVQSLDKKRIYDRILELCISICVNGASKRTATAKEKMKEMQEIAKSYQIGGDAIE